MARVYRRPTTAKVRAAARRNIRRAQLSRIGTREVRSIGRANRSRRLYSTPTASRAPRIRTGRR